MPAFAIPSRQRAAPSGTRPGVEAPRGVAPAVARGSWGNQAAQRFLGAQVERSGRETNPGGGVNAQCREGEAPAQGYGGLCSLALEGRQRLARGASPLVSKVQ